MPDTTAAPRVLNLRDTGGKVPAGAVYIGRAMPRYGLRQAPWANPYRIGKHAGDRQATIDAFRLFRLSEIDLRRLRGKDLACWCAPLPCHGDVLLKAANPEAPPSDPQEASVPV